MPPSKRKMKTERVGDEEREERDTRGREKILPRSEEEKEKLLLFRPE